MLLNRKDWVSFSLPLIYPHFYLVGYFCRAALVTTFRELRTGQTHEGRAFEPLSTVMITAEAVSVGYAAALHSYYYGNSQLTANHLLQSLVGTALKDAPEDLKKLRHYFNHVVKERQGGIWQEYYAAHRHVL